MLRPLNWQKLKSLTFTQSIGKDVMQWEPHTRWENKFV